MDVLIIISIHKKLTFITIGSSPSFFTSAFISKFTVTILTSRKWNAFRTILALKSKLLWQNLEFSKLFLNENVLYVKIFIHKIYCISVLNLNTFHPISQAQTLGWIHLPWSFEQFGWQIGVLHIWCSFDHPGRQCMWPWLSHIYRPLAFN